MFSTFIKSLICLLLLTTTVLAQQEAHDLPLDDLDEVTQSFEPIVEDYDEEKPSVEGRTLASYNNIRIATDFEHLTAGTDEFKTYIKKQLVPAVIAYLQAALKVKYPLTSAVTSTSKTLCGFTTPAAIVKGVKSADMVIIFNSRDAKGAGWMAATTLCTVSSGVKRPVIVNIGINTASIVPADPETEFLRHDLNIQVLTHEFIHALAMNGPLYKNFVDENGNLLKDHVKKVKLAGIDRQVLDLPPLTKRLKTYYGCNSVPGLFFENSGGAHVERRFFQWEIMTTGGTTGSRITEITLGFLEGTGWYIPNYDYAEPYNFGRGQGCGFLVDQPDTTKFPDEYCQGTGIGCTEIGHSGGYCRADKLVEVGNVVTHQIAFNCENPKGIYYVPLASKQVFGRGLGSKCFSGNLTTSKTKAGTRSSYCLTFTCSGTGLKKVINVNWGTDKFICKKEGPMTVTGYQGEFNCPDPIKFCNTIGQPTCLRNCMGRGTCTNGKCKCKTGFFGTDCGFAK